jgi:hypothetical protein
LLDPPIPDTRIQTPETLQKDIWPADFVEQFWQAYPEGRKTGKKAVAQKLDRIRKTGEVTWMKLMAGVARYVASRPKPEFTKGPMVWLNQGCWDDEITAHSSGSRKGGGVSFGDVARHGLNIPAGTHDTEH